MFFGESEYRYEVVEEWAKLPPTMTFVEVAGVAVDSRDHVYVLNRSDNPVMIFDSEGNFLNTWGKGVFRRPHGICIASDDKIYCADDRDHTVKKFSSEGQLLMTLGTKDQPSDTGYTTDITTIKRGAGPFNRPTKAAVSPTGDIYVADGYGNARIHKFSEDGDLLLSWGEPGTGPGQFNLPHGICIDGEAKVYVADRENSRIQIFCQHGEYITEWNDVIRPADVVLGGDENLYVAELGYRTGLPPRAKVPTSRETFACISILTLEGEVLARWGGEDGSKPGYFCAPHAIAVDSKGDIYVGEVNVSAGFPKCHVLQKFERKR